MYKIYKFEVKYPEVEYPVVFYTYNLYSYMIKREEVYSERRRGKCKGYSIKKLGWRGWKVEEVG